MLRMGIARGCCKSGIGLAAGIMLCSFMSFSPGTAFAQRSELGVFGGGSFYMGDLNPEKPFALTNPAAGLLFRYNPGRHLGLRINLKYGEVEGNDAIVKYNETRNLSFRSSIYELSGQMEINFLPFEAGNSMTPFSPFIFGGIGAFYFDPWTYDGQNQRIWLRHELTDVQDGARAKSYETFYFTGLFGIGVKYRLSRHLTGSLEWGMRYTNTDYLDDVSGYYPEIDDRHPLSDRSGTDYPPGYARGNPRSNDWYSFAGFTISYSFPDRSRAVCPYPD